MDRPSTTEFIAGVIAGGIAVCLWGEQLRRYTDAKARAVRVRAADTIQTVQERTGNAIDAVKEQVTSTLQAGQEVIRP